MDSHTGRIEEILSGHRIHFAPVLQISTEAARGAAAFPFQPSQIHALMADLHRKLAKIQERERIKPFSCPSTG